MTDRSVGNKAHALPMGKTDGCPECVLNVEAPYRIEETEGGYRCHYACADCGHSWFTSWKED